VPSSVVLDWRREKGTTDIGAPVLIAFTLKNALVGLGSMTLFEKIEAIGDEAKHYFVFIRWSTAVQGVEMNP